MPFRPDLLQIRFENGLPGDLLNSLRSILKELDIFKSDHALKKFVSDECPYLSPWKDRIEEVDQDYEDSSSDKAVKARINLLIAFLYNKTHVDHGNALMLFLRYLEEKKGVDFSNL